MLSVIDYSLALFFAFALSAADQHLIQLKRLASESLQLQGVKFDRPINQIEFDDDSWGDLILNNQTLFMMKAIVQRKIVLLKSNRSDVFYLDSTFLIPIASWFYKRLNGSTEQMKKTYSVAQITDAKKRFIVKNVMANLTWLMSNCFPFSEDEVPGDVHIVFKEKTTNLTPFSSGTAPLGYSSFTNTIEICCFDEISITRLVLSAIGVVNPLWRFDRDRYVKINWANIDDRFKYLFHTWNFDFRKTLFKETTIYESPFDESSILLYDPTLFTKAANNTKHPNTNGPTAAVSQQDRNKIRTWETKKTTGPKLTLLSQLDKMFFLQIICLQPTQMPPPPACIDSDVQCLFYSDQQKCSAEDIKMKCPLVCNSCTALASEKCSDVHDYCSDWSSYCTSGSTTIKAYMEKYCKNTCGCPSGSSSSWELTGDFNSICDNVKQSTIVTKEDECKKWCSEKMMGYCFWESSLNDGTCIGTSACSKIKNEKSSFRRFVRI